MPRQSRSKSKAKKKKSKAYKDQAVLPKRASLNTRIANKTNKKLREPVTQLVFRIIRSLHLRVPEKLTVLELKVSELTVSRFTLGFEG